MPNKTLLVFQHEPLQLPARFTVGTTPRTLNFGAAATQVPSTTGSGPSTEPEIVVLSDDDDETVSQTISKKKKIVF